MRERERNGEGGQREREREKGRKGVSGWLNGSFGKGNGILLLNKSWPCEGHVLMTSLQRINANSC